MTTNEMFNNFYRNMIFQDESLYDCIWEILETTGKFNEFKEYIDTKYPALSKYTNFKNDSEEGLLYYMEYVGSLAKKPYLDAYLVANYLTDKRPDLVEKYTEEWEDTIKMITTKDEDEDDEEWEEFYESHYKSDEELEKLYNELDEFATATKVKVNNVLVNSNLSTLFDQAKEGNYQVVDELTVEEKIEADTEPLIKINTEYYAKSLVEFIKALLLRAAELDIDEGYILARDFDKYNLGRLRYGDTKYYYPEYTDYEGDYLIADTNLERGEFDVNPYDSNNIFSIDDDVLTIKLNFSSVVTGTDNGDPIIEGGIPKYKQIDFNYLVELLLEQGITLETYSKQEMDSTGWETTNTDVLTIRYYRNLKDKGNIK